MLESSFRSAGQRCSAPLRVLCLQDDIAPRVLEMLAGAMVELEIGDPALLATDVGPVIDEAAKQRLELHAACMAHEGRLIHRVPAPSWCAVASSRPRRSRSMRSPGWRARCSA